jgi:hypothetical protein
MPKITNTDYSKILTYYGLHIPKNKQHLKQSAENILAKKLCSCIKKVGGPENEARAIGICTKTVINRKGLTRGKFKCRNGRNIVVTKTNKKNKRLNGNKKTQRRR